MKSDVPGPLVRTLELKLTCPQGPMHSLSMVGTASGGGKIPMNHTGWPAKLAGTVGKLGTFVRGAWQCKWKGMLTERESWQDVMEGIFLRIRLPPRSTQRR